MCSVGASRPRSQRQRPSQLPKPKLPPKLRPLLPRSLGRWRRSSKKNALLPRSRRKNPLPRFVLPLLRRSLERRPSFHVPWTRHNSTSASPWNVIRWFWLYRCRFWCWDMSKSGEKSWHIVSTCSAFFVIFCKKRNLGFVKGHMAGLHVRSACSSLVGGVCSLYIATRGYSWGPSPPNLPAPSQADRRSWRTSSIWSWYCTCHGDFGRLFHRSTLANKI